MQLGICVFVTPFNVQCWIIRSFWLACRGNIHGRLTKWLAVLVRYLENYEYKRYSDGAISNQGSVANYLKLETPMQAINCCIDPSFSMRQSSIPANGVLAVQNDFNSSIGRVRSFTNWPLSNSCICW